MNIIYIDVNFEKRATKKTGIELTSGDYNSTKLVFTFDKEVGTKIFEMKDPDGELVLVTEIIDNEVVLAKEEDGTYKSIFSKMGNYTYEISLYDGDSKLTSDHGNLDVKKEQVVLDGEVVTPYLPVFDQIMADLLQKQDTLVSGTNIKTINNQSLLGSGNITIEGGSGGTAPIVTNETLEFLSGSSARVEGEELIF